jgi:methylthioribose-1-phosphate isomerase
MKKSNYYTLKFEDDFLIFLDQTKLPFQEDYIQTDDYDRISIAIEKLEIRGAPAIGIAAAYGLALSQKKSFSKEEFEKAFKRLHSTRPTAVNLFWALNEIKTAFYSAKDSNLTYRHLIEKAKQLHDDDIIKCRKMAENGLQIFKKKSIVLTHCNTGKLATGGDGTAFNVIRNAFENNLVEFVYADESRPLFQGSRLTAFELSKNGIPFSINVDGASSFIIKRKKVDLVIVGADRIASNGDAANKIGTYNLAVSCKYHNIPFYIAAPTSTIDRKIKKGDEIPIEERNSTEIFSFKNAQITSSDYPVFNPAFDVTPAELISGIITEEGLFTYPYSF